MIRSSGAGPTAYCVEKLGGIVRRGGGEKE